jgi:hypothetical protein
MSAMVVTSVAHRRRNNLASGFAEGTIFLGYPTLAVMAQRAEYMNMSTSLADDETR